MSATQTEQQLDQSYWAYVKRQFRKNKRAVFASYFIVFLVIISLLADFLSNEKPLIAKYKGEWSFPVLKQYAVDLGLSQWNPEFRNVSWNNLEYDFVIFPPIPYRPTNLDYNNVLVSPFAKQDVASLRWRHWLGTDNMGRDVLAGMIHATRIALSVGIISMGIAAFIGIIFGSLAGYFGDTRLYTSRGRFWLNIIFFILAGFYAFGTRSFIISDALGESPFQMLIEVFISAIIFVAVMLAGNILAFAVEKLPYLKQKVAVPVDIMVSRLIEVLVSIPRLFLILAIVAAMTSPSLLIVMLIIGFTSWTGIARLIRAELLKVRRLEYVEAAQALGFGEKRTLLRHAIPNALSPVLIAIAFGIAAAVLTESFLSFLGIGVPTDVVTWGSLLNLTRTNNYAWWLAIFPGAAIFFTVTFFNLIGEGLTDALDPRLKQ